jgi:poly(A) polymerase
MSEHLQHPVFQIVSRISEEKSLPSYVIGGFVRDSILGRDSKDIDIVVIGSGIEMAEAVAEEMDKAPKITVFKTFGTAMLKWKGFEIEFVGARKESYRKDSRKPTVENGTLVDDQLRRDFTINALAYSLNKENYGELVDPFNGLDDLENRIIRTPCDPLITFSDDPLRMLRAIRFAAQLDFRIEDSTFEAIVQNAGRIQIISKERISEELNKIMLTAKPSFGFKLLEKAGLLPWFFPELQNMKGVNPKNGLKHKDNFFHTLKVLDNLSEKSDNLWLRWAALLHDIAKPETKRFTEETGWTFHGHEIVGARMVPEIFKKLKLPLNDKMKYVQTLVLLHLRPIILSKEEITDSAIRRLLFDAGDYIEDLMMLCEADITSKNPETVKKHLKNFKIVRKKLKEIEEKDAIRNFQPPVTGDMIIDTFEVGPGREVGIIKNAIKEAILDGLIKNNREEAIEYMLKIGRDLGLKPRKKS